MTGGRPPGSRKQYHSQQGAQAVMALLAPAYEADLESLLCRIVEVQDACRAVLPQTAYELGIAAENIEGAQKMAYYERGE